MLHSSPGIKTSTLSIGRGVRVKEETDLAVITLAVRFIPPTTANAVRKLHVPL